MFLDLSNGEWYGHQTFHNPTLDNVSPPWTFHLRYETLKLLVPLLKKQLSIPYFEKKAPFITKENITLYISEGLGRQSCQPLHEVKIWKNVMLPDEGGFRLPDKERVITQRLVKWWNVPHILRHAKYIKPLLSKIFPVWFIQSYFIRAKITSK